MKIPLIIGLLFTLYLTIRTPVLGQTMTNGSYKLEEGNLNSFAGQSTGTENKVRAEGNLFQGTYSGTNYKVQAGFTYLKAGADSFTFSILPTSVSFGKITPGEPITRTNTLTVSAPSSLGYQVVVSQNHPLREARAEIPDTTCDAGNCSQTVAAPWVSPLTYGFGYRCDDLNNGTACNQDFSDGTFYKQFANTEKAEEPEVVLESLEAVQSAESQITYKLNIPGTQSPGSYQNSILYIAVPNL